MPDDFLTVAEVAALLELNQRTVRNWIDVGTPGPAPTSRPTPGIAVVSRAARLRAGLRLDSEPAWPRYAVRRPWPFDELPVSAGQHGRPP